MSAIDPVPTPYPDRSVAVALVGGGLLWTVAALIGGDDGTGRFYASEAIWLAAQVALLIATVVVVRTVGPSVGRVGRIAGGLAALGRVLFVVAEALALVTGRLQDAILPPAALLTAVGSLVLGIAIVRARAWDRTSGVLAVLLGVYPFVAMFPLAASADGPPVASLAGWGIVTAFLGLALVRAEADSSAAVVPAVAA